MSILQITPFACGLIAITVFIHAFGLAFILDVLARSNTSPTSGLGQISLLLIRTALLMIFIHLTEIAVWGAFYYWQGGMPDIESALYFSGVTYTTVGYGDLVLPPTWRLLGPIEGLVGILMCGLSAGMFFALVSRIYLSYFNHNPKRLHSSKHPHITPSNHSELGTQDKQ